MDSLISSSSPGPSPCSSEKRSKKSSKRSSSFASERRPASLTASMLTTAGRTLSTMSAKPDIGMTAAGD
jgi:hypothetical protein